MTKKHKATLLFSKLSELESEYWHYWGRNIPAEFTIKKIFEIRNQILDLIPDEKYDEKSS